MAGLRQSRGRHPRLHRFGVSLLVSRLTRSETHCLRRLDPVAVGPNGRWLLGGGVKTVRQILDNKGTDVWSVTPETRAQDALVLMEAKNIGAVLVMDQENLVGILSERDFIRNLVLRGGEIGSVRVDEVMTVRPLCVTPAQTVDECMALMTDKRIRHLPVIDDGRVVGLMSIGDAVKATIAEQQFVIEQLELYIAS